MARYKTYHGRRKLRPLKLLLIILLIGGFVSFCVLVVPNYVTFTEEGISIDLPYFSNMLRRPEVSPIPAPTVNRIIIDTPSARPSPSPSPSPSPVPQPVCGIYIPLDNLADTEALLTLREKAVKDGINMLVLEIKNTKGDTADGEVLAGALQALAHPSLELAAWISACVDNTIPLGENTAWAVKHTGGLNFKDRNSNRWLSLYKPEVREYIAALVGAAYEAGFDRVILDQIGFPHEGSINQIKYGEEELALGAVAAVNEFLAELRAAYPQNELDASVLAETVNEGLYETAGQELSVFAETFNRLYVLLPDDVDSLEADYIPVIPVGSGVNEQKIEASEQGFVLFSERGEYFSE